MASPTAQNHFIPRAYLRNWSVDGHRVWTMPLLVPHDDIEEWQCKAIRSVAVHEHLYTAVRDGEESDAFERWLNSNIEAPASGALVKLREDKALSDSELSSLVRYAAALDQRTPAAYLEHKERWSRTMQQVLDRTMSEVERKLKRSTGENTNVGRDPDTPPAFPLPLRVVVGEKDENGLVPISAEVLAGRESWLHSMHRTLTVTYKFLLRHHWSIVRPAPGMEWFTSDHPVVRLSYRSPTDYNFGGGWGLKNCEIMLPLTPNHLLYTKVGSRFPSDFQAKPELTHWVQRFIAERASRMIFARREIGRVKWFRRRRVDLQAYRSEIEAWQAWPDLQKNPFDK